MNQLISFSFERVYGSVALSFNNGSVLPRMSDVQARLLLVTVPILRTAESRRIRHKGRTTKSLLIKPMSIGLFSYIYHTVII